MLTSSLQHGQARCSCGDAKACSALVLHLSVAALVLIAKESKCICMVQCLKPYSKGSFSCWLVCPAFKHRTCHHSAAHHCLAALKSLLWNPCDKVQSYMRTVTGLLPPSVRYCWHCHWLPELRHCRAGLWDGSFDHIRKPSKSVDVLYQADFSCAVAPGDLSWSVTLLWKKISVLRCFPVSRVLNIKNLACWRLDVPRDFLTPLVAGVSWGKEGGMLGCYNLSPWWCLWGEHGYKNFSSAKVGALAYSRMLEMLSWKVHWVVFLFD